MPGTILGVVVSGVVTLLLIAVSAWHRDSWWTVFLSGGVVLILLAGLYFDETAPEFESSRPQLHYKLKESPENVISGGAGVAAIGDAACSSAVSPRWGEVQIDSVDPHGNVVCSVRHCLPDGDEADVFIYTGHVHADWVSATGRDLKMECLELARMTRVR